MNKKKLRDEFALKALGMFTLTDNEVNHLGKKTAVPQHHIVSKFCYDCADAMLKERRKRNSDWLFSYQVYIANHPIPETVYAIFPSGARKGSSNPDKVYKIVGPEVETLLSWIMHVIVNGDK